MSLIGPDGGPPAFDAYGRAKISRMHKAIFSIIDEYWIMGLPLQYQLIGNFY
jgi:hypothetical protein